MIIFGIKTQNGIFSLTIDVAKNQTDKACMVLK